MVRYQFIHLFPGATNDGQTFIQGRFKGHGTPHGLPSPKRGKSNSLSVLLAFENVLFSAYSHVTHISVTASPTPQNLASSSMPSSLMTVLSTSKHTASALRKSSFVCERVVMVLQRSNGTVGKTHKAATYQRNHFSSGRFRPFNEALKAMDVFGAVKHQTRPPTPN